MHLLLLIAIIVLLLIIVSRTGNKSGNIEELRKDLRAINTQLTELTRKISNLQAPITKEEPAKPAPAPPPPPVKKEELVVPIVREVPQSTQDKQQIPQLQKQPEKIFEAPKTPEKKVELLPEHDVEEETWFDKWLRNNPDIEKFIGENLINKIGIAILVLGIGFFVKYAIDQNWINEIGRVAIGFLCGIILIGIAHRLRTNYRSFSSVLVGGGLTVFYFTVALAFHQYALIDQTATFIIMVVITAFAVILSILYDRIELAILATIGGFITPFLASTGNGNYIVLFTYLGILNAGLIALGLYKRWHLLNYIAFAFTVLIYGGWILNERDSSSFSYIGTFLFGAVFYFMFLTMIIIHVVKKSAKLNMVDFSLLLVVNLAFYGAGIFLLHDGKMEEYKGLFTGSLGLINLVLSFAFFKLRYIDRNFIFLLIGLTLTFISLVAPVQLQGNYITLFWAAETALLFWLYQRSFIKPLKYASALISVFAIGSLLIDWSNIYGSSFPGLIPVLTNKGFITTVFTAGCLLIAYILFKKEADTFYSPGITNNFVRNSYLVASLILFYLSGALEIFYQFNHRYTHSGLDHIYLQLYTTAFLVTLLLLLHPLRFQIPAFIRLALPALLFCYYVIESPSNYITEKFLLKHKELSIHFIAHWASSVLFLTLVLQTIFYFAKNKAIFEKSLNTFSWISSIVLVIFFSVEVKIVYIWLTYSSSDSVNYFETLYSKAGLSIVWGVCSFVFIWMGMHYRFKALRIIALTLFGITLLKLFAYDIRNISPGGKIAAFILLGVLLLIVSFMYQRLKRLIIDDVDTKKNRIF